MERNSDVAGQCQRPEADSKDIRFRRSFRKRCPFLVSFFGQAKKDYISDTLITIAMELNETSIKIYGIALVLIQTAITIAITERAKWKSAKRIQVHKLQFEHEFNIYKDIWAKLHELNKSTLELRSNEFMASLNQDVLMDILERVSVAGNEFLDCYERNMPFYHFTIYLQLREVHDVLAHEYKDVLMQAKNNRFKKSYWQDGHSASIKINGLADLISQLIQNRISIE